MADEQGAPSDFGGRVLPNPTGIKPVLDTEIVRKTDVPTAGAHFSVDNPPAADLGQHKEHPVMQHFSKTKSQKNAGKPVISEN